MQVKANQIETPAYNNFTTYLRNTHNIELRSHVNCETGKIATLSAYDHKEHCKVCDKELFQHLLDFVQHQQETLTKPIINNLVIAPTEEPSPVQLLQEALAKFQAKPTIDMEMLRKAIKDLNTTAVEIDTLTETLQHASDRLQNHAFDLDALTSQR